MRLIDADKLMDEFRKMHISFNSMPMEESDHLITLRSVARIINRQQTVWKGDKNEPNI